LIHFDEHELSSIIGPGWLRPTFSVDQEARDLLNPTFKSIKDYSGMDRDISGTVIRARNKRTGGNIGALLVWSVDVFGQRVSVARWSFRGSRGYMEDGRHVTAARDADEAGDDIEVLDFTPIASQGVKFLPVTEVRALTPTEGGLPARCIHSGQRGLLGENGGPLEIEFTVGDSPRKIAGVWTNSSGVPNSVSITALDARGEWQSVSETHSGRNGIFVTDSSRFQTTKVRVRFDQTGRNGEMFNAANGAGFQVELIDGSIPVTYPAKPTRFVY